MNVLQPPDQYGIVESGIYRSNMPQASNFQFIQTLQLKKVLLLSPETPTRAVLSFFEECHIEMFHLGLKVNRPTSSWKPLSEELVKEGIQLALDPSNHPMLIMCTSGIHQTGTFVGCLRKLQRWNFNSIVVEYRAYAGSKSRYMNEQFIELFDIDLITLPKVLPVWFAENILLLAQEEQQQGEQKRKSATKSSSSSNTVSQPLSVQ